MRCCREHTNPDVAAKQKLTSGRRSVNSRQGDLNSLIHGFCQRLPRRFRSAPARINHEFPVEPP
ncbi:hypothetical protein I7I48_05281 [Histoplasma ohiense]|nr:hypothetical protein I7I48_05281 [Histoplasma ohiense (nom. inval.)]